MEEESLRDSSLDFAGSKYLLLEHLSFWKNSILFLPSSYINCICAPDTGPKGFGGLMTGWLYIKVGCVITGTLPI